MAKQYKVVVDYVKTEIAPNRKPGQVKTLPRRVSKVLDVSPEESDDEESDDEETNLLSVSQTIDDDESDVFHDPHDADFDDLKKHGHHAEKLTKIQHVLERLEENTRHLNDRMLALEKGKKLGGKK
eukprot:CAMPEP_0168521636 /NCGR_PEP_ID=MMETSP0405-20121227/8789_1 /TAXON_ID=498012 /ORGANISM="Trichosphaerium sp, Strain Am-I-7 wt" /LENGTH=125 /DNA_ID=CAMNT_0008542923 /DNA_START=134 /DNA_END=511 /DNA_ORIENTATION=-